MKVGSATLCDAVLRGWQGAMLSMRRQGGLDCVQVVDSEDETRGKREARVHLVEGSGRAVQGQGHDLGGSIVVLDVRRGWTRCGGEE